MNRESYVVVIDTPSIKQFVFGTDALNETRGASALLDWLNQNEMERKLRTHPEMAQAQVETIYANGGAAQFLIHESDETAVRHACISLVRYVREETGGEVRLVFGIALYEGAAHFREATRKAHFQLRCQREFASGYPTTALTPVVMECQSTSHLPAVHMHRAGSNVELLSTASDQKRRFGRSALQQGRDRGGPWAGWMHHLEATGPWPQRDERHRLRCASLTDIGDRSSWRNYVGIVYADGNAMGRVVQAIGHPETSRHFSEIVDQGIREACFQALDEVCRKEIAGVRATLEPKAIPADILFLGGDDLLVALPADRALDFTLLVTDLFERLTREKIGSLEDPDTRAFFQRQLRKDREFAEDQGFTISCGVAIVKSSYPFYLSLDLAEQLLRNAKRDAPMGEDRDLSRIDFHVVAGANSHVLEKVREDDYLTKTREVRTLRPLSRRQLQALRTSVQALRDAGVPRSKLHALQEAALDKRARQAAWRIKEIFGRSRQTRERSERHALWHAIQSLKPNGHTFKFPWFVKDDRRLLCVADLMEAYELFPPEDRQE